MCICLEKGSYTVTDGPKWFLELPVSMGELAMIDLRMECGI